MLQMQSLALPFTFHAPPPVTTPSSSSFPNPTLQFLTLPARTKLRLYRSRSVARCSFNSENAIRLNPQVSETVSSKVGGWTVQVGTPSVVPPRTTGKLSLSDQAFFLLSFIACTTSVAFASLVVAAVPTLYAFGRAANSLSKLADTAREELPSTMAAVRLSGMEISDLTMELSDLSQEISEGVTKSAQVVQAAEAGIRQIGTVARDQTLAMIQERANLPIISLQPAVVGAAKKTSKAVGKATKSLMNMISRGEAESENEDNS